MASVVASALVYLVGSPSKPLSRTRGTSRGSTEMFHGTHAIGRHERTTNLIVYALIEENTQRPPICANIVALPCVHLWCEIGKRTRLTCQHLARNNIGGDILE